MVECGSISLFSGSNIHLMSQSITGNSRFEILFVTLFLKNHSNFSVREAVNYSIIKNRNNFYIESLFKMLVANMFWIHHFKIWRWEKQRPLVCSPDWSLYQNYHPLTVVFSFQSSLCSLLKFYCIRKFTVLPRYYLK